MGEGEGEDRAQKAAKNAITSPLMTFPVTGAKGILLNVTTGSEIMLGEMSEAAKIIEETADQEAQVIWGHVIDETLGEKVHVTLIATFPEDESEHLTKARLISTTNRNDGKTKTPQTPPSGQQVQPAQKPTLPPAQTVQPQIQQPQQPQQPRRTIFDIYTKRRMQQEGLEEARLTQASPNDREAFPGVQRGFYDQPAIYRKTRRD